MFRRASEAPVRAAVGCSVVTTLLVLVAVFLVAPVAIAQQAEDEGEVTGVVDAFKRGTPHLVLRYRYEFVDQDNLEKNAHASTLRTAFHYRTAPLRGFSFFIEAENVVELGDDWYRDVGRGGRGNGVTDRPVVADPAGTSINQVLFRYQGHDTDVQVGRQEINIDDQRFVGAVGWRQHHQTFRAFNIVNQSVGDVGLRYSFTDRAYRIFGDEVDMASHFLHGSIDLGGVGQLNAYGYLLDYSDEAFEGLSTNSFGFEFAGRRAVGSAATLHYEIEYARQHDGGGNPNHVRANYAHLLGGIGYQARATVKVGWELLGGSAADGAFSTPLATLHKFNGWADKFLNTPAGGLRDLYLTVNGTAAVFNWLIAYHDFRADTGGARYGNEFNWQITYQSPWRQTFATKGAYYDADEFSVDTLKVWIWTGYTF